MVIVSAEPVIFIYFFCYTAMILLGQDFILERLQSHETTSRRCAINNFSQNETIVESNISLYRDFIPLRLGAPEYETSVYEPNAETKTKAYAIQLYMLVTAINAITSIITSQVIGYWMDRISRRVLMMLPTAGGVLWAFTYVLVGYFEAWSIEIIFIGVFLGGICGGYVTLKTAVTSYIIQETPEHNRTMRLSAIEASVYLGAATSLFTTYFATRYLTTNYSLLFIGVEVGFILSFFYALCILREDVKNEYAHLSYSYDDLDGHFRGNKSMPYYGSIRGVSQATYQQQLPRNKVSKDGKNYEDANKVDTVPSVQIEECSTSSGSHSDGTSVGQLNSNHSENLCADQYDSCMPLAKEDTKSVKSIYGTPPTVRVNDEEIISKLKGDTFANNALPGHLKSLHISQAAAATGSIVSVYGTPPDKLSIADVPTLMANTATHQDQAEDIRVHNTEKETSNETEWDLPNGVLKQSARKCTIDKGLDKESNHQSILDAATVPNLMASTITICSQIETGKSRKKTPTGNIGKYHKFHPAYASDSILNNKSISEQQTLVGKRLHGDSYEKNPFKDDFGFHGTTDVFCKSTSTPDSLNNCLFDENVSQDRRITGRTRQSTNSSMNRDSQIYNQDGTHDTVDGGREHSCCGGIIKKFTDAVVTTFRPREDGKRSMVIADVVANFFVSLIFIVEYDNVYVYLNSELNWHYSRFAVYYGIKCAVDGISLLLILPILRYCFKLKDATLGIMGGVSRIAFFVMLALLTSSKQVYVVPLIAMFGQYLFVSARAIMSSLVEEEEQGRVFTVLCSVEQLALFIGALAFDNLFSFTLGKKMPGVTFLVAGFTTLVPTLIFGALYFSIKSRQQQQQQQDERDDERRSLLGGQRLRDDDSQRSYSFQNSF